MRRYTVKQVAKLSGTSVRTLHYYDEIDLLSPSYVGDNGYRYYQRPALFRLQQILFYRDLGMSLSDVAKVIDDSAFSQVEALREHRSRLTIKIENHRLLISTINQTIQELGGDTTMERKNPFVGFAPEQQAEYERALVSDFGSQAQDKVGIAKKRMNALTPDNMRQVMAEVDKINLELVTCIDAEQAPNSAEVQALIQRHYKWVVNFWTPDKEAYLGLGKYYESHSGFRDFYDAYDRRLVGFLAKGMKLFAERTLSYMWCLNAKKPGRIRAFH